MVGWHSGAPPSVVATHTCQYSRPFQVAAGVRCERTLDLLGDRDDLLDLAAADLIPFAPYSR
jgi:hypothetical protein